MSLSERAMKTRLTKGPEGGMELTTEGGIYHISRCESCGRLLTKLEIVGRLDAAHAGKALRLDPATGKMVFIGICSCGSSRFRPSNAKWWEYLLPRVMRLAFSVWRGQVEPGESR